MSLEISVLAAAATTVAKQLYPAIDAYIKRRHELREDIELPESSLILKLDTLKDLSDEQLADVARQLSILSKRDSGGPASNREAENHPSPNESVFNSRAVGVAFSVGHNAVSKVFEDARRRTELVFKINLAVAIVLAFILLTGIGAAIFSAVFLQRNVWALAFGGVTGADIIGLYVFKPLTAINKANYR